MRLSPTTVLTSNGISRSADRTDRRSIGGPLVSPSIPTSCYWAPRGAHGGARIQASGFQSLSKSTASVAQAYSAAACVLEGLQFATSYVLGGCFAPQHFFSGTPPASIAQGWRTWQCAAYACGAQPWSAAVCRPWLMAMSCRTGCWAPPPLCCIAPLTGSKLQSAAHAAEIIVAEACARVDPAPALARDDADCGGVEGKRRGKRRGQGKSIGPGTGARHAPEELRHPVPTLQDVPPLHEGNTKSYK